MGAVLTAPPGFRLDAPPPPAGFELDEEKRRKAEPRVSKSEPTQTEPLRTRPWGQPAAGDVLAKQGIPGVSPAGKPPLIGELGVPMPSEGPVLKPPRKPESAAEARGQLFRRMAGFGPGAEETALSRAVAPKPSPEVAETIGPLMAPEKHPPWQRLPMVRLEEMAGETRGPHRAILEFAGGLTAPENAALITAAGKLRMIPKVGAALGKVASGGFSALMLQEAFSGDPEWAEAKQRSDVPVLTEIATRKLLEMGFGTLAGVHAVRGARRAAPRGIPPAPKGAAEAILREREVPGPAETLRGAPEPPLTAREAAEAFERGPVLGEPRAVKGLPPMPEPDIALELQRHQMGPVAGALPSRLYGLPGRMAGPTPIEAKARAELGPAAGAVPLEGRAPWKPYPPTVRMEPPPIPEGLTPRAEIGPEAVPRPTRVPEPVRAPEAVPEAPRAAPRSISEIFDQAADEAMGRLRARGQAAPEMGPEAGSAPMVADMADLATWGAAKFAKGMTSKAAWAKEMARDAKGLGRVLPKQDLEKIWKKSIRDFDRFMQATSDKALVTTRRMLKMYEEGKEGKEWWKESREEIDRAFGEDAPVFKGFIAATSPQKGVEPNLNLALMAYRAWKTNTPFNEVRTPETGQFAWSRETAARLQRVAEGDPNWVKKGPKIRSMLANLLGDESKVTVDRWIARVFGFDETFGDARYRFMDYTVTQVAEKNGMTPAELQAALWTSIKNAAREAGEPDWTSDSFRSVLRKKAQSPAVAEVLALSPETFRVDIGLKFSENAPLRNRFGDDISPEVAERTVGLAADAVGVRPLRTIRGRGAYLGDRESSIHVELQGTPEQVRSFMDVTGYLLQQNEVYVSRTRGAGNAEAVDIHHEGLRDPVWADHVYETLRQTEGTGVEGYQLYERGGIPGIRLIGPGKGNLGAISAGLDRLNIDARARGGKIELEKTPLDPAREWYEHWKEDPTGGHYKLRIVGRGRGDLAGRVDSELRPQVETWLEEARVERETRPPHGPEAGFLNLEDLAAGVRGLAEAVKTGFPRLMEEGAKTPEVDKARLEQLRAARSKREAASQKRAAELAKEVTKEAEETGQVPTEPRLTDKTAQFIASDVPVEVIHKMQPKEVKRVMFQVADLIEFATEKLPETNEVIKRTGMSEVDLAYYLRDAASKAGRTLGSFGQIGKELKKVFTDPDAQKILNEISKPREPAKWHSYKGMMDLFMRLEMVRLASMVSQIKTATRNAYTQVGNYSLKIYEDVVDGSLNVARGKESSVAYARAIEDVLALSRMAKRGVERVTGRKGPARKTIDEIFEMVPLQGARVLQAPIMDVVLLGKYAKVITALNRFQELTIRKMAFDGSIRAELARMGYGKELKKAPAEWNIPKGKLATAAELAADSALKTTWAATPKGGPAKAILNAYREVPLLRLIQPFPRFYFANAMRHIFEYSPAGLVSPKLWQGIKKGDHRLMAKATAGIFMAYWAYAYRGRDDSPGRWYVVKAGGKEIDTRPFAPLLAPYLFMGEFLHDVQREQRGEPTRLKPHDYTNAVLGMNRIAGTGLALVDAFLGGRGGEWKGIIKTAKEVAGSYIGSFTIPALIPKDVLFAPYDPEEAKVRDIRGQEFTAPSLRNIPVASKTLPELPAVTRPGPLVSETPRVSQLTGILPKESTWIETELSKLGMSWRDIIPQGTGDAEIDRQAKFLVGDKIESVLGPLFSSEAYQKADDAMRKEMVSTRLSPLRNWARKMGMGEARVRPTQRLERTRGAERLVPFGTTPPPAGRVRPVQMPPPIP